MSTRRHKARTPLCRWCQQAMQADLDSDELLRRFWSMIHQRRLLRLTD